MRHTRPFGPLLIALGLAFGVFGVPWHVPRNDPRNVAWAATDASFTPQAFAAAQHEGRPILVYVSASWCATCAIQRPVLDQLIETPEFHDLAVYRIDFDTQKDLVRAVGAQAQSTLIVFRGTIEKGRLVGDTDRDAIKALLERAYE